MSARLIAALRRQPEVSPEQRDQLSDEKVFDKVCKSIYRAQDPQDLPVLRALLRDEMAQRRQDQMHDGDRLMLCAFLLALRGQLEDLPDLQAIKRIDFDMGCYFDSELLDLVAGKDEADYVAHKLKYFRIFSKPSTRLVDT